MLRYGIPLLFPVLLLAAMPVEAGWPRSYPGQEQVPWGRNTIEGTYRFTGNGGICHVYARPNGYVFINERGERGLFASTPRGFLQLVRGRAWNPGMIVRPTNDEYGRTVLRFDVPGSAPTFWVSVD